MTQGLGVGTRRKQQLFYHANALGMSVVAQHRKLSRYPYWLFDGNCGSGWNSDVEVVGSPITAQIAADHVGLAAHRRRFHFCDHARESMLALQGALTKEPAWEASSYLHIGDNEEGLAVFAQCIAMHEKPEFAVGVVIIDPNGWFYRDVRGVGPPIDGLLSFTQRFRRIDVVLNLNLRTYWMQRGQYERRSGPEVLRPIDVLRSLNRRHWLVGKLSVGQSRFWVAVGRNFETGDHRKIGLHHLDSDEGQNIMLFAEGRRQGDLFNAPTIPALSKLPSLSQASGVSGSEGAGVHAGQPNVPLWDASD